MATTGKVKNRPTNFVSRETLIPITVMARRALAKQKNAHIATPRSVRSFARNVHLPLTLPSRTNKSHINSSAHKMLTTTVGLTHVALVSKKPTPAATSRSVSTLAEDIHLLPTLHSVTQKPHQMSGATSPMASASYTSTANTSISNEVSLDTPEMSKPSLADEAYAREKNDSSNEYVTWYVVGGEDDEDYNATSFNK